MPFYDDFDLSTVDVLLISQYVSMFALRSSIEVGGPGVSLQSYMHGGHFGTNVLYIRNNGILFAPSSSTPVMCPLTLAPMYIAASSTSLLLRYDNKVA
jgi:hypothetical protein